MVPSGGATEKIPSDTTGNRSPDGALTTTLPHTLQSTKYNSIKISVHLQFTFTIYIYNLYLQFTFTIYIYYLHLHLQFIFTIYIYNLHLQFIFTIYIYNLYLQFTLTIYIYNCCLNDTSMNEVTNLHSCHRAS
jgi:hypothetical protein